MLALVCVRRPDRTVRLSRRKALASSVVHHRVGKPGVQVAWLPIALVVARANRQMGLAQHTETPQMIGENSPPMVPTGRRL